MPTVHTVVFATSGVPKRDKVGGNLSLAQDAGTWHGQLVQEAYPCPQSAVGGPDLGANSRIAKDVKELFRGGLLMLDHGQNSNLQWRQKEGQVAAAVLEKKRTLMLQAAEQLQVNHHRVAAGAKRTAACPTLATERIHHIRLHACPVLVATDGDDSFPI